MDLQSVLAVCLGIGLSAACGFRVFVPFLVMNLAARAGYLVLAGSFQWIASTPALVMFAVATLLEIGAYYIPWLDNALDSIATPAAAVAGFIVSAAVITGMDPTLKWPLAAIAGGGIAGAVQAATVAARGVSVLSSGGATNPLVSTVEAGASVTLTVLALLLPIVAAAVVVLILATLWRLLRRRRA
jgi:Domain of unknown function (DUF4126)